MPLSNHLTEALFQLSKLHYFHDICDFPIKCPLCTARVEINTVRLQLKDWEEHTNFSRNFVSLG